MHHDIERVLLTEDQIQAKVAELGRVLSEEYKDKNPIVVGVLKGVVLFYADMIRNLTVPCQMDFMWISSYAGTESTGNMIVRRDVSSDIKGRHVLVLEDIYDVSFQYLSFAPMDGNDDSAGLYGAFRNYYAVSPDHKKASTPSYRTLREFMEKKDDALEQNRCFLRYLFLDFLYDLEHSEVFMNSEYYEVLYSNLHDDFYFHSISCKAEFYYQRQLADMWRRGKDGSAESLDDEMLEHLGDYLIDAETKWVDCLSSPGAEDVLYHGNRTWFTDIEEEMDAIYVSPDRSDTIVGEIENKALVQPLSVRMWHTAKKASDWYIDRYNFMGTLKIWHSGHYVFWAALIIAAVVGIITLS